MNRLTDIITYVRRIVKTPSNEVLTDNLIIDYINRFWLMDVDARMQLFDLKTKYTFQTTPGICRYNMPLYQIQNPTGDYPISYYPIYQGFESPMFVNGIQMPFYTQQNFFYNLWPTYVQQAVQVGTGNGTNGPYSLQVPFFPAIPGNIDLQGITKLWGALSNFSALGDPPFVPVANLTQDFIQAVPVTSVNSGIYFTATGNNGKNIVLADSGFFLDSDNEGQLFGLLMNPGTAPYGNTPANQGYYTSAPITGATQANPCVLTCTASFPVGSSITIESVGGMTELNGNSYVVTANSGTTITIDVDSTLFTPYTSGGTAYSYQNIINYATGIAEQVYFNQPIPAGQPIYGQCYYIQQGLSVAALFYNNTLTLYPPPYQQLRIDIEAYLTPAAFLSGEASIPFAYMCEYIARGAARKILSDTGDVEQFNFYEPLFREQESLVWKRSQRVFTSTRTQSIWSNSGMNQGFNNQYYGVY